MEQQKHRLFAPLSIDNQRLESESNCLDDDEVKTARIQNNLIINRGNIMIHQFSNDSAASPLLQYNDASSPYKTAGGHHKRNGTAQKESVLGAITYSPFANKAPSKIGENSADSQSPAAHEGKIKHISPSPVR